MLKRKMIIENKRPSIEDFYKINKSELDIIFNRLLLELKSMDAVVKNKNTFYREYIMYSYRKSAYI